jgi:hypothetical protein
MTATLPAFGVGTTRIPATWNLDTLSDFQVQRVAQIVGSDDFDFACTLKDFGEGRSKPGPFAFMWYTCDGRIHAERIGLRRVLHRVDPEREAQ